MKIQMEADGRVDMSRVSKKMANLSADCWNPIMKYVMRARVVVGITRIGTTSHNTLDRKNAEKI